MGMRLIQQKETMLLRTMQLNEYISKDSFLVSNGEVPPTVISKKLFIEELEKAIRTLNYYHSSLTGKFEK